MSRWEIQIALLISAGVMAISIPPASGAESAPGVAVAVLETLPVKGELPRLDIHEMRSGRGGLMLIAMDAIRETIS